MPQLQGPSPRAAPGQVSDDRSQFEISRCSDPSFAGGLTVPPGAGQTGISLENPLGDLQELRGRCAPH